MTTPEPGSALDRFATALCLAPAGGKVRARVGADVLRQLQRDVASASAALAADCKSDILRPRVPGFQGYLFGVDVLMDESDPDLLVFERVTVID
jgi:hypothetical protein